MENKIKKCAECSGYFSTDNFFADDKKTIINDWGYDPITNRYFCAFCEAK